jgi:SNF2 family DNA or RNA helicase
MQTTIKQAQELVDDGRKVIVWAQFRPELNALSSLLSAAKIEHGLIHGGVKASARPDIYKAFKDKDSTTRVLVAHPRTAGTGLNLAIATAAIYFSNGPSYASRVQSEERIYRMDSTGTVNIYDVDAVDAPIDAWCRGVLTGKKELADMLADFKPTRAGTHADADATQG